MRKLVLFLTAALLSTAGQLFAQEELPQWANDLMAQNPKLIDSIYYFEPDAAGPSTRTYVVYYHQPMKHAQPDGEQFPLRAFITVFKDTDPTKAVNHIYASGYNLDDEDRPDSAFVADKNACSAEIAWRYHANYIQLEHRYFQFSAPAECWTRLDDLRAEEAAADFHNLFDALKKVLKGKCVMSGVSKGGITTLLQHKFYPNDMDIYVPYAAPFFDSDRDLEMQKYWYSTGWSQEFRDMFMAVRKQGIYNQKTILPIYVKMNGSAETDGRADTLLCQYMLAVASFGINEHSYSDTATIRKQISQNATILHSKGIQDYCDTVYAYMLDKGKLSLADFPKWIDTLRKYPDSKQVPVRYRRRTATRPFGITYSQWVESDSVQGEAYEYQSKCELGFYDYRFDLIIEDPADAKQYNDYWVQHAGCMRDFTNPYYRNLTFNPTLYNETMAATQSATKPIVLIYGLDDDWTGAAVKDRYINGTTVHKFILPAQNHLVRFSSNTDKAQCDAIRSILDGVLSSPQGFENETSSSLQGGDKGRLVFRDGQILILRGDKAYTIMGQEIK